MYCIYTYSTVLYADMACSEVRTVSAWLQNSWASNMSLKMLQYYFQSPDEKMFGMSFFIRTTKHRKSWTHDKSVIEWGKRMVCVPTVGQNLMFERTWLSTFSSSFFSKCYAALDSWLSYVMDFSGLFIISRIIDERMKIICAIFQNHPMGHIQLEPFLTSHIP